jgi:hypothetical protein
VRQLGRHRATKELVHAGSKTAAAATYDDHFRIEDLGEPPQGMGNVPSQFTELNIDALSPSECTNPFSEAAVENGGVPIPLIRIDRSRLHRSIGMLGHDVGGGVDVRANQNRIELASETGGLPDYLRRLLRRYSDHDVVIRLVICHSSNALLQTPSVVSGVISPLWRFESAALRRTPSPHHTVGGLKNPAPGL